MIAKAATIATLIGLIGGGIWAVDTRYAQKAQLDQVAAKSKKYTDLEYYDRRVSFVELRVELYCKIRPSPEECAYWQKQLRAEKAERERALRK